jgi:hypothetical protein
MEASTKLLQQLLKDLSPHERKEAVTMFAVIGMEAYLQRHHEDVNLSGSMIKVEHGMYLPSFLCFYLLLSDMFIIYYLRIVAQCYSKLLKHHNQHFNTSKEGESSSSKGLPATYKKSIDNTSKQSRRHDGLKHYPFVDEFGSVMDVLKEVEVVNNPSKPISPDAMMDPILKHTIKKSFDEFKIGSNGMKAADIPEALKVFLDSMHQV